MHNTLVCVRVCVCMFKWWVSKILRFTNHGHALSPAAKKCACVNLLTVLVYMAVNGGASGGGPHGKSLINFLSRAPSLKQLFFGMYAQSIVPWSAIIACLSWRVFVCRAYWWLNQKEGKIRRIRKCTFLPSCFWLQRNSVSCLCLCLCFCAPWDDALACYCYCGWFLSMEFFRTIWHRVLLRALTEPPVHGSLVACISVHKIFRPLT